MIVDGAGDFHDRRLRSGGGDAVGGGSDSRSDSP